MDENIDFTVDIADQEEPCRSGSSGDNPVPPRLATGAKLIALWNLLFGLVVGVPFVLLMSWVGDDFGTGAVVICGLLFACAHTAASSVSFKRYKRKYEVSAPKFVLISTVKSMFSSIMCSLLVVSLIVVSCPNKTSVITTNKARKTTNY